MFLNFLNDISILLYIKLWVIKLNKNKNFNLINAVGSESTDDYDYCVSLHLPVCL